MRIATLINSCGEPYIGDAIDSIQTYVGDNNLMIVDGARWKDWGEQFDSPIAKMRGIEHGVPKSPYKNMALGLSKLVELWRDCDWYCYTEPDVLFTSSKFKEILSLADEQNVWMMGANGHLDYQEMKLVESMLHTEFRSVYYLLGACLFFSRRYMEKLQELDFFSKFLNLTSGFSKGDFPKYQGYDISEHMYPTIARHYGGNIAVMSIYDEGKWHGNFKTFPVRWKPEIEMEEIYPETSIVHPVKKAEELRGIQREKRELWKIK